MYSKVISLNCLDLKERLSLKNYSIDMIRGLVFLNTTASLLIVFNFRSGEIENVMKITQYRSRVYYLPLTSKLVLVNNRSEICFMDYRQKMFFVSLRVDLGLLHLKKVEEIGVNKLVFLESEGELMFFDYNSKKDRLCMTNRVKPLADQAIKNFIFIFSVSNFLLLCLIEIILKSISNIKKKRKQIKN